MVNTCRRTETKDKYSYSGNDCSTYECLCSCYHNSMVLLLYMEEEEEDDGDEETETRSKNIRTKINMPG